ncbi:transcription factor bHLH71-like [Cynara cardunculus var. scolymus]|uniref:transcription factor bHLH71-like n=1 Tax=Cynara cardunculus var. scolymus TaxID=59895 RepID=UPI000D62BD47|nr:transcription factor bHLH71-like [Cynara cardunculus var. scolymus]
MNHIAVERNRRKQMNHHLAALRSLLPESYLKRGDQASIIGGAIEFVKELEHLLQSLEAQKFLSIRQQDPTIHDENSNNPTQECEIPQLPLHFQKFFTCPQYTWSSIPNTNASKSNATMADIEVNLVQTHANLRILSRKRLKQLSKMVVFLQTCYLSILHLNVTTFDPFVLYSITLKVEEGCCLNSADEIAGAVHQILGLIEQEATLCIDSRD